MERSELVRGLREIDSLQPYGTELFDALALVTVSVAVEAVCLRLNLLTQKVEVYMTQRSQSDSAYFGQWHCPGSVMRPRENIRDVFNRLAEKEFGSNISSYRFVANVNHPYEDRGHFLSIVYLCVLEEKEELRGKWFLVNNLPKKTVETHAKRIIPVAIGAFVAENTQICF
ncbi:MAG: hypothetical protein CEN87_197 [Parcubacteria group bacterium Licking1014_1]|nr:MAG: hypothetical protein CEN87_197 [Parcubacteria group bacterium Licking1014_1]